MSALRPSKDGHLTALNRWSRRLARGRFPSTTFDMNAAWWLLTALAVLALAYRYYSAFLAAKVLCLNDERQTPAHERNDGHNFHPTNKWVLFGHHFAAITGAGPLIGP